MENRSNKALDRWKFVRDLSKTSHAHKAKIGDSTSLTTAEALFLAMVSRRKLLRGQDTKDGGAHFADMVEAAVARERLRQSVSRRVSLLRGSEIEFLTALVENDEATLEMLESAVRVLDHCPLYNSTYAVGGGEDGSDGHDQNSGKTEKRTKGRTLCAAEKHVWEMSERGAQDAAGCNDRHRATTNEAASGTSQTDEKKGVTKKLYAALQPLVSCCGVGALHAVEDGTEDGEASGAEARESRAQHLKLDGTIPAHAQPLSTCLGPLCGYPILGMTCPDGSASAPPVLSPLLMRALRDHLPYALREENFWLKYSLVRDVRPRCNASHAASAEPAATLTRCAARSRPQGASLEVLFDVLRHSRSTVLAIETSAGEVCGSFTSSPWRVYGERYFGSCEAFVWRLRTPRGAGGCRSLGDYVQREGALTVYPWDRNGNRNIQLSTPKKLLVGGGEPREPKESSVPWGAALALDRDLLHGVSSRCATFASDPIVESSPQEHDAVFEIVNMEIWASQHFFCVVFLTNSIASTR